MMHDRIMKSVYYEDGSRQELGVGRTTINTYFYKKVKSDKNKSN